MSVSCECSYDSDDDGPCKNCYKDLKAKVAFLRLCSPTTSAATSQPSSFSDVVLFASDGGYEPVPAHKAVLVSRSPVFKAMLETEMDESLTGTIKIADVSFDALRAFVNYLYTAEPETRLGQQMACDLLILAEKYQVQHLKDYCQKFLLSNLNLDNALMTYAFAHQHNAKRLVDAALTVIIENMDKLTAREEYAELKKKDPQIVFEIYEAFLSRQISTTAAQSDDSVEFISSNRRHFLPEGIRLRPESAVNQVPEPQYLLGPTRNAWKRRP